MRRPSRHDRLTRALWLNAGAVALLALAVLGRNGLPSFTQPAQAQVPPIGGAGIYVMPGQIAQNMWGAYVLDTDRQTLLVYRYDPSGGGKLLFLAARDVTADRRLPDYNTFPDPQEMKAIADKAQQKGRLTPPAPQGTADAVPAD